MRAWEMSIRRFTGLLVTSGTIILGGYGLMLLVTPTDEQIKARMSPEMRRKFDDTEQERMERKEKLFEHLKYNMNSNRPIWDVQWDKLKEDRSQYPEVRTNFPAPPRKEGKNKREETQNT